MKPLKFKTYDPSLKIDPKSLYLFVIQEIPHDQYERIAEHNYVLKGIVDNGAFEGYEKLPNEEYVFKANSLNASFGILPDVYGNPRKTYHESIRCLKETQYIPKQFDWLYVLQAPTDNSLKLARNYINIKKSGLHAQIGGYCLSKNQKDRNIIAKKIREKEPHMWIHFLGYREDEEDQELYCDSIDSHYFNEEEGYKYEPVRKI